MLFIRPFGESSTVTRFHIDVTCYIGSFSGNLAHGSQIIGVNLVITILIRVAVEKSTGGMKGIENTDVFMRDNEVHQCTRLGFATRVIATA